jgi:hypothetical protein
VQGRVHICRFDSTLDLFERPRGRRDWVRPTYEEIKARVLEAGRFSIFEATYNQRTIAFFTRLGRDPEVVCITEGVGYPWIRVERKIEEEKKDAQ